MTTFDDFKRSLDQLVQQAQHTAQLGFTVAKEQVEDVVKGTAPLNDQMEEVRRNLQAMAREMESRAQELVKMAGGYVQPGRAPSAYRTAETPAQEPPAANESATAAGAGTTQDGSDMTGTDFTAGGEAPKQ